MQQTSRLETWSSLELPDDCRKDPDSASLPTVTTKIRLSQGELNWSHTAALCKHLDTNTARHWPPPPKKDFNHLHHSIFVDS
jgi:hypothetical protein